MRRASAVTIVALARSNARADDVGVCEPLSRQFGLYVKWKPSFLIALASIENKKFDEAKNTLYNQFKSVRRYKTPILHRNERKIVRVFECANRGRKRRRGRQAK